LIILKSSKVGIFGGSFDPPHKAHVELVLAAKNEFQLDHLFVVPSKYPPGKIPVAPFDKRLEWVKTIFAAMPGIEISDMEGSSSSTVFGKQIFAQLGLKFPSAQYFWLLGEDQFDQLNFWKDIDTYAESLLWIVMPRDRHNKPSGVLSKRLSASSAAYFWTSSDPMVEIASHRIREALQIKKSKKTAELEWIPEEIRDNVVQTYQPKGEVKN